MSYPDTQLLIDGQWQPAAAGQWFDKLEPATGERLCQVAASAPADVDAAVAAVLPGDRRPVAPNGTAGGPALAPTP